MRARVGLIALLAAAAATGEDRWCSCGVDPPGPPKDRQAVPYAGAPEDMRPFSHFTKPYYENYTKLVEYNGAARDLPAPDVSEVRIGFLGPVRDHPDQALGKRMLNGATLAIEEANARGGYCGKPFRLMVHNDGALWGSSSNEIVKMRYDDEVWAMLGSISGDSTHIGLRVSLKAEVPIVNSASTDPTIPETIIPWYLTTIQDDRVQSYTLARRIYTDLGLKRIALLRVNDRYGRFGVIKFRDASRRLGHPVVIEQKYMPGEMEFRRQLAVIAEADADGIVLWGDAAPAGAILKQMRAAGMKQRVFGSYRVLGDDLFHQAGDAAEGLEVVFPYDPTRDDPGWVVFRARYQKRFAAQPEAFASLSYDTMNILLGAVCRGGLNRGRIRDALTGLESYKGVTGEMAFDPNCKNVVPMYLATVRGGKATFRPYPMQMPYATVPEKPAYNGPAPADVPAGPLRIGIFGPKADETAAALAPGGKFAVTGITSELAWGKASRQLVDLIYEGHALALIATDRNSAHLAEQLAVKAMIPVLAISADRSLESVNIPWLFRLEPGTTPREALARLVAAAEKSGGNRGRLREALAASAIPR
jgi:branched-chain amino acid transport system substrate-binding protein